MDYNQIEKQIQKISFMLETFKSDGDVSPAEKDLLLDYTKKLYGLIDGVEVEITFKETKIEPVKIEEKKPEPIIIESPIEKVEETVAEIPQESFIEPRKSPIVEGMDEIFAQKEITELSDKLSFSPIADLTKSMGINERILTVRELFGGDSELFNTTMQRLNKFSSYDEAKSYLQNGVALDHNWNSDEKLKKAANFIKLVQRRYV